MEGRAYTVPWVGGEPLICQTDPAKYPLSYEDEAFIAQHARDVRNGKQPGKAAAAAPEKPEAQGSSRGSATPKQPPASKGLRCRSKIACYAENDMRLPSPFSSLHASCPAFLSWDQVSACICSSASVPMMT